MESTAEPILLRYRGRDLTAEDVSSIRAAIATHYERGRTYIVSIPGNPFDETNAAAASVIGI